MVSPPKNPPKEPKIEFGCPSVAELVTLYAQLAESAKHEDLQKLVDAVQNHPNDNFVVEARTDDSDKKLVGYLHAWANSSTEPGIVYEIAVNPERREEDIAKKLLAHLRKHKPRSWRGNSFRISENLNRHLTVVRTLYAVALTFGFQKVVEATYFQVFHRFSVPVPGEHPITQFPPCEMAILILLFFSLGLLGIRFFWATGNIRRFLLQRVILLDPPNTRLLLFVHFPLLILHAVLFFFLCRFYWDICVNGLYDSYVSGLLTVFTFLLVLNIGWLYLLRRKRTDRGPEFSWMVNNIVFALLGVLSLWLFYSCPLGSDTELLIAAMLVLANSALDFVLTGGSYFLGDAFGGG
jgi:hypothetical protein